MKSIQHNNTNLPILITAFAYLAFVIYGSLVPLNFKPMPLYEAWVYFQNIRYLELSKGSLADWVANILLFIPLTFIWLGLIWPGKNDLMNTEAIHQFRNATPKHIVISLMVLLLAISLSFFTEFAQLFFPPRTVSQNDIIAESIGATIGIFAWWWIGPQCLKWLKQLKYTRGAIHIAERILWIYLAILFGYNVLPLDLTISPVEIYHKWKEGRVVLLPFSFVVEDKAQLAYNLITDIVIWAPVGFLWVLSGKKNKTQAWVWAVLAAISLEILQLLVYTRVTDTTDIVTAMLGALGGVWLTRFWKLENAKNEIANKYKWFWIGLAAFFIWSMILIIIFWYPFNFQLDRQFLRERLELFLNVPFYTYYYGTEFRAITEVFHKVAFFIPLGAALSVARIPFNNDTAQKLFHVIAITCIFFVAGFIELGQVALPSKFPDNTDVAFELIGALIGYFGFIFISKRLRPHSSTVDIQSHDPSQQ